MPDTNTDRSRRGNSLKRVLAYVLQLCKDFGYISDYEKNYSAGKPGYTDQTQFKAHYRIFFPDNTEWIVSATTSIRDRIKEHYWDSFNLKEENSNIKEAYLVLPDSLKANEQHKVESKNRKIQSHGEYSPLNAIVSQDSFFNIIEEYALREYTPNQRTQIKGNNFERRVAAVLSNPCNFEKWKSQDTILEGLHYSMFTTIVDLFGLDSTHISRIDSTSDKTAIGPLPSGGQAKTDVLTTVTYDNGDSECYTISCKRSSNRLVSVHQYSADAFSRVLDPENNELKRVLHCFQACGNLKDMLASDRTLLTEELQPHILALCKWAIAGVGGEGDPTTQWARYIVVYDNNDESFHVESSHDFCLRLSNDHSRSFGTPFSWSYQGQRGNNIQLRCPIKLE